VSISSGTSGSSDKKQRQLGGREVAVDTAIPGSTTCTTEWNQQAEDEAMGTKKDGEMYHTLILFKNVLNI
jgi:hypothetical protein